MALKQKTHAYCLQLLNDKIQELENILKGLSDSATNNTKSSAGDKHETARAMVQIDQENIGKQLHEVLEQRSVLEKIDGISASPQIMKGSLIKTNKGYLFLAVPLGKISVDGNTVVVISPQSPLGVKLMGLSAKNSTNINGINYVVESIY